MSGWKAKKGPLFPEEQSFLSDCTITMYFFCLLKENCLKLTMCTNQLTFRSLKKTTAPSLIGH